jgi:hypothetical protein
MTKVCNRCGFPKDCKRKRGKCNECLRDLERERARLRRQSDPRWEMHRSAKYRAKRLGIPFDLTLDDIVIPEYCPVLGIRLMHGDGKIHDASPTLDKTDPAGGYVRSNTRVMSHRANRIKTDATIAELRMVLEYLEKTNG